MYKFFTLAVFILLNIDIAYASNMGGMDKVFNLFFISVLLGGESFLVLILFILKKFKKSKYRKLFNIITIILYVFSALNLGPLTGDDLIYMFLLLFACGALAIILPNIKTKNNET